MEVPVISLALGNVFVFIFGVCIGSFLNCVIYRLEKEEKITGRSYCPHCKHQLKWQDLFPVFSFIFLGGKCRYCKKSISWQYPIVEISTALLFLLIFNLYFLNILNIVFLFYVAAVLVVIFVFDLKHFLIPDKVLIPAICVSLVYRLFENFPNYLIAGLIASGFFLAIYLVSGGRAMGFGDVKLAILMGLLLGLPNVLAALFLAFFFGAIISVILIVFYGKKAKSEIPFGPFLIAGTFFALFWGNQIVQWYLNFIKI